MADPLSIAAGILAVTLPAIKGTQRLIDFVTTVKDVPEALENLKSDLVTLNHSLHSLESIEDAQWALLGQSVADQTKNAIGTCTKACETFERNMTGWMASSSQDQSSSIKISFKRRLTISYKRQIDTLSDHLQTCKMTFVQVVSCATL